MSSLRLVALLAVLTLGACFAGPQPEPPTLTDAATGADGGQPPSDAAAADTGAGIDSGVGDSGVVIDAGRDAAADAGDAAMDAGDAATDAGDAAMDAGDAATDADAGDASSGGDADAGDAALDAADGGDAS